MRDLFSTPVLPGLATTSDFITETEERALIATIDAVGLAVYKLY
jgi:DNA oxidative demethylase